MIKKLRRRFVCIVMAIVTGMLCVIFGLVIHSTAQSLENQSLRLMQAVLPGGGPPGREERPQVRLPYFSAEILADGSILFTDEYGVLPDEAAQQDLLRQARQMDREFGVLKEYDLRFRRMPSPMGRELFVFADISGERETMEDLVSTCIGIGILALLAFWAISVWLARWAVRPVEQAWQQQKQFVADASHELKTPLTVITTNAELLQARESGAETDSILTMARQMRSLVEGMLELARVDNGAVQADVAEVDLSELASEAVLPFEPLYFERGLVLEDSIEPGIRVRGSGSHLKQVVDILLDNALKYAAAGGTVVLRLEKQGSHGLLSVASPGEPIAKEDLTNIFKRFYRVDKARSRDGSFGLGLSIAQRIVEEHRGRIWAESSGGVNTFYVQLPL